VNAVNARALSRRGEIFAGLAAIAAGAWPLAIGLGVAKVDPRTVHAPLWVVAAAGACFVLAGMALLAPRDRVRLRGFAAGLVVTALAAVCDWIAFGPGERRFGQSISFAGAALRSSGGQISGRIAFGVGAVLLDAFALWAWYRWLKGDAAGPREKPQSGME
jgi:hypothetical protein